MPASHSRAMGAWSVPTVLPRLWKANAPLVFWSRMWRLVLRKFGHQISETHVKET